MSDLDAPTSQDLQDLTELNTRVGIRTAIPAIVTGFQKAGRRVVCSVQLAPKQFLRDGRYEDIQEVERVPVGYLTGGGVTIRMPLEIGDGCMCHVSDRTLAGFLSGGGRTYRPFAGLTHDINDIIAYPMIQPDSNEPQAQLNPKELYIGDYNGAVTFMRMNVQKGEVTINCINAKIDASGTADVKAAGLATVEGLRVELKAFAGLPGGPFNVVGVNSLGVPTHAASNGGGPLVWVPNPFGQVVIP